MFWKRRPRIEPVRVGDEIDDTCAVLTMIARHHGRDVEPYEVLRFLEQVAEEPELDRSALDIINAARELGLEANGLQIEHPLGFSQLTYPCVGHVTAGRNHGPAFVVLEAKHGPQLSIIDPYLDRAVEAIDDFVRRSSGVVIVFEPGQPLPTAKLRT
jgi:ABC-type bacteriocin/lantibiotic exporter with double-glycine peptidase domain